MGELSTLRKASLPIMAAVGGVVFPILIYLAFNWGKPTVDGWAIPMATDIAFTIGILKLLGKRVPYGLLIFLTAFAIVDDLASVMVIAIYYSTGINWTYIFFALGIIAFLYVLGRMGIYTHALYLLPGLVVWYLFLKSGIHPTIAGVLLAFTIPVRRRIRNKAFEQNLIRCFDSFTKGEEKWTSVLLTQQQLGALDRIESLTYLVQPPLQFLENRLPAWVIYFIMPVFALANAGVSLGIESFAGMPLILSIAIALLAGKSIGISLLAWLAIKLNIAELPEHTSFRQLVGAAFLGGLGFTMSLFIANLSFSDPTFLSPAKAGILLGSMLSGVIGYILLRFTKPHPEVQLYVEELEGEEAPAC
jgi:NhaA family Na+:H+ antiporter